MPIEDEFTFNFKCNEYEKEAALFYNYKGYKPIRLDHFTAIRLRMKTIQSPPVLQLAQEIQKSLPPEFYKKFTFISRAVTSLGMNLCSPKQYPLAAYPPDFIMVDKKSSFWHFVEVKSPFDKLHFRQANWFVNLKPDDWEYEIFATSNKEFDEIYSINLLGVEKEGVFFEEAYKKHK